MMVDQTEITAIEFDRYAESYDDALNRGISVSGEDKFFFAQRRVEWLARCLAQYGDMPRRAMDYGCGTGSSIPFLLELPGVESAIGVDISAKLLQVAEQEVGSPRARFVLITQFQPAQELDLVFCNGVFHHIPIERRAAALHYIYDSLAPGGKFALWENNPWNPGTRLVMSRIPFDRDAITLSGRASRRMLRAAGFEILRTDFLFVFPRFLRPLRALEPHLIPFPLGAQYQVLGRKPI
jgi:SAM-dependent methyltransferase